MDSKPESCSAGLDSVPELEPEFGPGPVQDCADFGPY